MRLRILSHPWENREVYAPQDPLFPKENREYYAPQDPSHTQGGWYTHRCTHCYTQGGWYTPVVHPLHTGRPVYPPLYTLRYTQGG